jgi:hypothetical protein
LIFALINLFALSPITRTKYPNHAVTIRKANRENAVANPAKAEMPFFNGTVREISRDDTTGVCKGKPCPGKRHAMLVLILAILFRIPLEPGFDHAKA